jgi:hypothetical protein
MAFTKWRFLLAIWTIGLLLLVVAPASAHVVSSPKQSSVSQETVTLTVDPVARLSSFVPYVEITGTLTCDEGFVTIIVDIRQRAKGEEIGTVGMEDFSCSVGTWSMLLRSDVGEIGGPQFKPGKAEVVAGAFICDDEGCTIEEVRTTVRIRP